MTIIPSKTTTQIAALSDLDKTIKGYNFEYNIINNTNVSIHIYSPNRKEILQTISSNKDTIYQYSYHDRYYRNSCVNVTYRDILRNQTKKVDNIQDVSSIRILEKDLLADCIYIEDLNLYICTEQTLYLIPDFTTTLKETNNYIISGNFQLLPHFVIGNFPDYIENCYAYSNGKIIKVPVMDTPEYIPLPKGEFRIYSNIADAKNISDFINHDGYTVSNLKDSDNGVWGTIVDPDLVFSFDIEILKSYIEDLPTLQKQPLKNVISESDSVYNEHINIRVENTVKDLYQEQERLNTEIKNKSDQINNMTDRITRLTSDVEYYKDKLNHTSAKENDKVADVKLKHEKIKTTNMVVKTILEVGKFIVSTIAGIKIPILKPILKWFGSISPSPT